MKRGFYSVYYLKMDNNVPIMQTDQASNNGHH